MCKTWVINDPHWDRHRLDASSDPVPYLERHSDPDLHQHDADTHHHAGCGGVLSHVYEGVLLAVPGQLAPRPLLHRKRRSPGGAGRRYAPHKIIIKKINCENFVKLQPYLC